MHLTMHQGPYYLIVEGLRGPQKQHTDIESARTEAQRLHRFNKRARSVYILAAIESIKQEVFAGDPKPPPKDGVLPQPGPNTLRLKKA